MTKAKRKSRGFEVTEDDRELWWELARRYMRDRKNPAVQRWAWEKAAPFINPRVAAKEMEKDNSKEFVVRVEDYRTKKPEIGAEVFIGPMIKKKLDEDEELESELIGLDDEDIN